MITIPIINIGNKLLDITWMFWIYDHIRHDFKERPINAALLKLLRINTDISFNNNFKLTFNGFVVHIFSISVILKEIVTLVLRNYSAMLKKTKFIKNEFKSR